MHTWKISIHALLAESDRGVNLFRFQTVISIHALLAESDPIQAPPYKYNDISIHALLAESDESKQGRHYIGCNFYPRSPCGERRECQQERRRMCQFLSTLSLRRATEKTQYQAGWTLHFYPRSPCGERLKHLENRAQDLAFLSTLSLRRATFQLDVMITTFYYFYPRSPCGERPNTTRCRVIRSYFYPRSPCGERHSRRRYKYLSHQISIHALLAESDAISGYSPAAGRNFYPRSPCGERLYFDHSKVFTIIFLSTLSLRRATGKPGQRI